LRLKPALQRPREARSTNALRCWRDGAELPLAEQVIALLGKVLDEKDVQLGELVEAQLQEAARAQAEAARAQAEAARAQAALRRGILRTLTLRGLVPDAAQRERIETCDDTETLERWDARVLEIAAIDALLYE
jgi:hypothetical protein